MYKPKDGETPSIFPELFPYGGRLDPQNRWMRLAALIPWREVEQLYSRYHSDVGRPAKDARLVCGLLMVRFLEGYSYERIVQEFSENPYIQYLCGFESFVTEPELVSPGLLSRKRRALGDELFARFESELLQLLSINTELRGRFRHSPRGGRSFWARLKAFLRGLAGL